ncbi:MAG: 3'(2'),5'-bisphosphate nucleotidase CysQ [Myxococcales bacterium]|nr:3'(2'),5'-bisphosphate nucleotidase CysQ [Myxococcales bacterium]
MIAPSYAREIEVASQLAREAGALAVAIRDRGPAALGVEHKAGDEPVTVADRAASDLIVAGLRAAFPDDCVVSEESADDLARLTAPRVWYVDPIDGTKDFIRGSDGFAVMIGLCLAARPVIGVVFQPTSARLFAASPERGAWMELPDGAVHALAVSTIDEVGAIRLVASKSHRSEVIDEVKSALGIANELNIGSVGLKLALIALGERDLYVNPFPKCKAWDTCAPEAILVAAGGVLTDTAGDPVRYDQLDLSRPHGLVASNGHVHAASLARLARLFPRT